MVFTANMLTSLNSKSFGSNLKFLELFSGDHNKIDEIDLSWFEGAENMQGLYLYNNLCSNQNYEEFQERKNIIQEELQSCFNNFEFEPPMGTQITCYYGFDSDSSYTCNLELQNCIGFNEFRRMKGNHLSGQISQDVREVFGYGQDTPNIPTIICRQFGNLERLWMINSNIEFLSIKSFTGCGNLVKLSLNLNHLVTIPERALPRTLKSVDFSYNRIEEIHENAFLDLKLESLFLSFNEIQETQTKYFSSSEDSLEILSMKYNKLTSIPHGTFTNFTNLKYLAIDHNQIAIIDSLSFSKNLESFIASFNKIDYFDPEFFNLSSGLNKLDLQNNICVNENFKNITQNRNYVMRQLDTCIENFGKLLPIGTSISCSYEFDLSQNYKCNLGIKNPKEFDFFIEIDGNHLNDQNNEDVKIVSAFGQNTPNIPSIICEMFENLEYLWMVDSMIAGLKGESFKNCRFPKIKLQL